MKIELENMDHTVRFSSLNYGDCFTFPGSPTHVYMKGFTPNNDAVSRRIDCYIKLDTGNIQKCINDINVVLVSIKGVKV